ncbi:HTH_Tnp_Tc3_2 domain-containing protein [Trichonephila clavipes]|uniref:HTH_Tnp_Tc3_2 domain-containing protein n=1 Tax=Trichonephila clavipes TaxID=2585209 RepID=A0A8X6RGE6_TRICX|nr:HTH_Tnp_Tc3_2 domain-containing protein [Trichonephila clavipes]
MSLRSFRRQHEQLSQFERGRIIGMMESGWSARRFARQLDRSGCAPTASSAAIQAQVAPSLGAPVSSRTIRRRLAEGHLGSRRSMRVLPLTPAYRPSVWSGDADEETGLQRNGTRPSLATNPDSISALMAIVFVCLDPSILSLL